MAENNDDNPRARLVKEMMKQRELDLKEQADKYESRIQKLKEKKPSRRIFSKRKASPPKQKARVQEKPLRNPKSPLALLREKESNRKEIINYRREKARYPSSFTGRLNKVANTLSSRENIKSALYQQERYRPRSTNKNDLQRLRLQLAIQKARNQQRQQQNFLMRARPQDMAIGWESSPIAAQLEREINSSNGGEASAGDVVARRLSKETSFHGNFALPPHSINVDREVQNFSKMINFSPSVNIDREVMAFANILNPRRQAPPRKRRR